MLNTKNGKITSIITGGDNAGKIIYIDEKLKTGYDIITLDNGKITPLMNFQERAIYYVAGPSGSGKSTYASELIKNYIKVVPKSRVFIFSRTNYKEDPAFKNIKMYQIEINDDLLINPIDITTDIDENSILFFDDCNTIQNAELKKYIEGLMADIMEVGRKLKINIIITSHLINVNSRNLCRTIMNEMHYVTFFPKSGSAYQINYMLKNYFGLSKKKINEIMEIDSRWITISKNYPLYLMYEKGIMTL